MRTQIDPWIGSVTFGDHIFSLFDQKKTKTTEFETWVRIFGREKMEAFWKLYVQKQTTKGTNPSE